MFRGTIPSDMRSMVWEIASDWRATDLWVGCSGNFTIERIFADSGLTIHGNDVTLYTSTIGSYLAGQPLTLSVKDEYADRFGWLEPYLADPESTVATIMLSTRMLLGADRANLYYERMRAAYRDQWAVLHAKTVERVKSVTLRLASYHNGDVMDFVNQCPSDQAFVCFPPFFAGDYETMNASLDAVFAWPKPIYPEFEPREALRVLIEKAMEHRYWLVGTKEPQPDLLPLFHGLVQTTNRGVPIYLYSSSGKARLSVPRQPTEPILIPRLGPGDVLEGDPRLVVLTGGQFNAVRSQYMNAHIVPGSPTLCIGVVVGRHLVGALALNRGAALGVPTVPLPHVYLLSDFPVAPTDYPRLSRLIAMVALTREVRQLGERMLSGRIRTVVTTAFSKRPVSMKYRGTFDLIKRDEKPDGTFMLNYAGRAGQWTLEEAYDQWQSKHLG